MMVVQSHPVNRDTDREGAIESVRINGVSVLSGLNLEKTGGLSFRPQGQNQNVRNNEEPVLTCLRLLSTRFPRVA